MRPRLACWSAKKDAAPATAGMLKAAACLPASRRYIKTYGRGAIRSERDVSVGDGDALFLGQVHDVKHDVGAQAIPYRRARMDEARVCWTEIAGISKPVGFVQSKGSRSGIAQFLEHQTVGSVTG